MLDKNVNCALGDLRFGLGCIHIVMHTFMFLLSSLIAATTGFSFYSAILIVFSVHGIIHGWVYIRGEVYI